MEHPEKFVEFEIYCRDCEYFDSNDGLDPCNECLNNPTNRYSTKPINFKKKRKEGK